MWVLQHRNVHLYAGINTNSPQTQTLESWPSSQADPPHHKASLSSLGTLLLYIAQPSTVTKYACQKYLLLFLPVSCYNPFQKRKRKHVEGLKNTWTMVSNNAFAAQGGIQYRHCISAKENIHLAVKLENLSPGFVLFWAFEIPWLSITVPFPWLSKFPKT